MFFAIILPIYLPTTLNGLLRNFMVEFVRDKN